MKNIVIIIISVVFLFSGCVEKVVVIPPFEAPTGNKVVLVEDLTGVGCTNCPTGATKLENLQQLYGKDKLVIVGIHGSLLTNPLEDGEYDLQNDFANDIESYLQPFIGKPAAGIDRRAYEAPDFAIASYESWSGYVEQAFEEEVTIDLNVNSTFDESTRKIDLEVIVSPQEDNISGNYKLSVMLTESGIVTSQKGPSGLIDEYEHKHVLRSMMTNFDGNAISISETQYKTSILNYDFTLPEEDGGWNADHMDIIVFVANADTKVVIQTKTKSVK